MDRRHKIMLGIAATALLLPGPFMTLKMSGKFSAGNDPQYDVDHTEEGEDRSLSGKRIIFLGSSVTYGSASLGDSFVDYLAKRDGILPIKEAVSGTTLVDEDVKGRKSYVARLKTIDRDIKADAFVCQLSTNDASLKKQPGTVSDSFAIEDLDTKTVAGAIEYIIAYVRKTWNCPILFYTGTRYNSVYYEELIGLLKQIAEKWKIEVLDLWHDEEMNQVSKKDYRLYMVNGIHPSKAGYREWWTPKFEEALRKVLN